MEIFHRKEKKIKQKIRESFGKPKTADFDFDAIRYYADGNKKESFQVLTDKVCNDLNFNDLFSYVDRTSSSVGQQYLYDQMHRIPDDRKALDILEKWISNDRCINKTQEFALYRTPVIVYLFFFQLN